jgi:hypothetical protein
MLQQANPGAAGEGYEVMAAQHGLDSLASDVAAAKACLARVTRPAILVGHSCGGTHITHAETDPRVASISRPAHVLCRIRLHVEAENPDPKPVEAPRPTKLLARKPAGISLNEFATFVPDGGTVPQTVLTDGRRPMFRSMRHPSLRRAKSRRRSLWTSVHSHSRTSLQTRR